MKLLIDCGANINIISKKWALTSGQQIFKIPRQTVKGVTGNNAISEVTYLPIFSPIVNHAFEFSIFDFHTFFDGIIGTGIIFNKYFNFVSNQGILQVFGMEKTLNIPIHFYTPTPAPRKVNSIIVSEKLRLAHLGEQEKSTLIPILEEYQEIFHNPNSTLSCVTNVNCDIRTTDDLPIYQKTYPYPMAYKDEVDKQMKKLIESGIIRPSRSPWNSPVWVVPKKMDASGEKKFRLVIDYRKLNQKTISDRYPMPEISNILDQLGGNKYFSTLDLASGFHQIKMNPKDIEKTAFSVNYGKYEFVRMPFGLKNAPAIFQRAMNDVLREHIGKRCYVYIDDVVVFGKDLKEHNENLRIVLKTLHKANLKVQLDKSEFMHTSIEFLGYVISDNGIKPNEKKIEAIMKFPEPKDLKQLRGFLGLIGYYRRFVKDFAKIAKPLTNLLRGEKNPDSKKQIILNPDERKCFDTMKNILTSNDVLAYPDFSKPFLITTDASNFALGAVLSQGEIGSDKPIHFASRTLNRAEENYSATEKEMLAIYWALKVFRNYIYGQKFKIVTDHQPLTFSLSPRNVNAKLKNWKSYLEEHDYEIVYKPGRSNVVADALSRIQIYSLTPTQHSAEDDDTNYILSTEAPLNVFKNQVIIEKVNDSPDTIITNPFPGVRRIVLKRTSLTDQILASLLKEFFDPSKLNGLYTSEEILGKLQEVYKRFFSRAGLLKIRFTQKILTDVSNTEEQERIIRETHLRAHRGINENKEQILREFYFPKLTQNIKDFISVCDVCNTSKYDRHPLVIPIQETPIPRYPFQIVHIDVFQIESHYFLSSIDKFSKYGRMVPIESRNSAHIEDGIWTIFTSHVTPESIVVDNEKGLQSPTIRGWMIDLNIRVYLTPHHKSEVNGVVERFHSTILELYRIQKQITPETAVRNLIQTVVEKYNNSIHSSTTMTPKEIVFGKTRNTDQLIDPDRLEEIRQKRYDDVLVSLTKTQDKQLSTINKNRRDPPEFVVGKEVFVKDKIIRAKHKPKFKKHFVQQNNNVTFKNEHNSKLHKSNVKNINVK